MSGVSSVHLNSVFKEPTSLPPLYLLYRLFSTLNYIRYYLYSCFENYEPDFHISGFLNAGLYSVKNEASIVLPHICRKRFIHPNFVFFTVLPALGFWLLHNIIGFIWLSAFAAIIFRSELCLFVGPLLLVSLLRGKISIKQALKHAIISGALALSR